MLWGPKCAPSSPTYKYRWDYGGRIKPLRQQGILDGKESAICHMISSVFQYWYYFKFQASFTSPLHNYPEDRRGTTHSSAVPVLHTIQSYIETSNTRHDSFHWSFQECLQRMFLEHWKVYLQQWPYVHNRNPGWASHIDDKLSAISSQENSPIFQESLLRTLLFLELRIARIMAQAISLSRQQGKA